MTGLLWLIPIAVVLLLALVILICRRSAEVDVLIERERDCGDGS